MPLHPAHPISIWLLLAGLLVFGGSLAYSLRTGKTYFKPTGQTVTREGHPVTYWGMCAFKTMFVVATLIMIAGKLRHP